jgi:hypothetical protein
MTHPWQDDGAAGVCVREYSPSGGACGVIFTEKAPKWYILNGCLDDDAKLNMLGKPGEVETLQKIYRKYTKTGKEE